MGAMTTVRADDSDRADKDASASSPVPCSPTQWRRQQQRGRSCTLTTATGRTMMPRHHHLSLARPCKGDGSGSGGRLCASMTATGQAMMPRHHHLSLARPCDANGNGGGSGGTGSCTSTTVTGRAMMPRHHHLSLACLRDDVAGGRANDVAHCRR